MMKISDTLYVVNREEWREWLTANYTTANEIWLVYYRKHSGVRCIPYNHAVEEALCFGWIDSIIRTIDPDRYCQRFTPRKPGSSYSQPNKERLRKLIEQGKVIPEVLAKVRDVVEETYEFPPDIEVALRENAQAWENFQRYSGAYQRIRVVFVEEGRKRVGEYEKRLKHLIEMSEKDKQYGFGIEEYY